eukprot:scaffold3618_cov129-Cylindrotheca_fusiformis.AAC.35
MNTRRTNHRHDRALSPIYGVGWMSLMLSLASRTSAFYSSTPEPLAMIHREGIRKGASTAQGRQEISTTRLQYRDGSEDIQAVKPSMVSSSWWDKLFPSQSDSATEQDSVDEYLEFLDRRYNRLHEEGEEKPFSAISWLLEEEESSPANQQKENALYVLGVAGMASQKFLQKHPHLASENEESKLKGSKPIRVEALDAIATASEDASFGNLVIKKVLVPLVKVMYFVHRRKQVFFQRVRQFSTKTAKMAIRSLVYGPAKAADFILEIGGGKSNIASTLAFVSTICLLLRPLIQAVATEGSM